MIKQLPKKAAKKSVQLLDKITPFNLEAKISSIRNQSQPALNGQKVNEINQQLANYTNFKPEVTGHADIIMRDLLNSFEPVEEDIKHYQAAIDWLLIAQQKTNSGGFAAGYSFSDGWLPAYPETTGYIIPTLLDAALWLNNPNIRLAALLATDWEIDIQMGNGAIQSGYYGNDPSGFWKGDIVPAAFNTGQVMQGWNQTFIETNEQKYLDAAIRAGEYLVTCIDEEGIFRQGLSPGPTNKIRSYYTRVAHALAWTGKLANKPEFIESAKRHLDWVLTQQQPNGWFNNAQFHEGDSPLTHNLAYTAEGLLDAGVLLNEQKYITASQTHAIAIQQVCERRGFFLPATIDKNLKSENKFSCLTGNAQFAGLWLRHGQISDDITLINSGLKMVDWMKGVQSLTNPNEGIRGAIAGDWPIDGGYSAFRYLNWPTKFYADALLLVMKIKQQELNCV